MLFIGICGASGSGKSTLAEELATMVNKSILIINQDAYYKDHPDLSFDTNSQLKCLTERIRFFVLTKPSEVRRTGGTLNGTRQSQSEKDGARIKPF